MGSMGVRRGVATIVAIGIAVALLRCGWWAPTWAVRSAMWRALWRRLRRCRTLPTRSWKIATTHACAGSIRPIYEPEFGPVAESPLDPDELVMGLVIDGDARAYPVTTLRRREMVNDVLGGQPVLVTW